MPSAARASLRYSAASSSSRGRMRVELGDDGDFGPEAGEALGEFDRGRPGADDQQAFRKSVQRAERVLVEVTGLGQSGHGGDGRPRAGGDHETIAGDRRAVADPDGVVGLERRGTVVDVDPACPQHIGRFAPRQDLRHRSGPRHDRGEVHFRRPDLQPIQCGRADLLQSLRGLHQTLARHTGREHELAAELPLLDQGHLRADPGGRLREAQAARTPTDHDQVVHRALSICRRERNRSAPAPISRKRGRGYPVANRATAIYTLSTRLRSGQRT